MEIILGVTVCTDDGQAIGELKDLVVNPSTGCLVQLVVQEGLLCEDDQFVPIDAVKQANADGVTLGMSAADFEAQERPPIPQTGTEEAAEDSAGASLGIPPSLVPPGLDRVELNDGVTIPADDVLLTQNCPIQTSDELQIGRTQGVIVDPYRRITHVILETGVLNPERKLVPGHAIAEFADNAVILSIDAEADDPLLPYGNGE